ncbi:EAL domain-containing protein [uncultured Photobacterium sp.]|uniref:EAL domain-containing protein n=1 Tax=uncultured Photobacterium sp. TaxID=173973 RepID=UPI002605C87B|nr:EAL domain-containing protein [uncultured Photobacterium sp.]
MAKILRTRDELEQYLIQSEAGYYSARYDSYLMKSAFQPIVSASGQLFGYEALLRIYDESGFKLKTEPFFSSEFMNSYDRINIDRLARVIHLRNFALFVSKGTLFLNMTPIAAVDLDSQPLSQQSFIDRVHELGLSIDQIYFEILEHNCACDKMLVNSLRSLQELGARIAIDDYGVNASSESRARNVKPDIIKVDRSLLADYINGKPQELQDVIQLARELKARVLLEGIEDYRAFVVAKQLGVDYLQGYFIGRPELVNYISCQFEPI